MTQATATFEYEAQTHEGAPMNGTIDAASIDEANRKLQALPLRVMRVQAAPAPPRARRLTGDDFIAFNQQLAHLASAGLPIEQGLRLIAQDMRSGRMAASVRQVADDLERGMPLDEAFARHRGRFPTLYGALMEAGIRTGRLPAMLLNLGRHLQMVARVRAAVWRAVSYPLMVLLLLIGVITFLGLWVLPIFVALFRDFGTQLPGITVLLLRLPAVVPILLIVTLLLLVGVPLLWQALRVAGKDQAARDYVLLPLPIIGPVLRNNLLARWCDALRIGIEAGMDLPAAMRLASDAVGSPLLRRDAEHLVNALEHGVPMDETPHRLTLPPALVAVLESASRHAELPRALETLSQLHQQQAELRLARLQQVLLPALLVAIAVVVGFVVVALFAPFIALLNAIMGPGT